MWMFRGPPSAVRALVTSCRCPWTQAPRRLASPRSRPPLARCATTRTCLRGGPSCRPSTCSRCRCAPFLARGCCCCCSAALGGLSTGLHGGLPALFCAAALLHRWLPDPALPPVSPPHPRGSPAAAPAQRGALAAAAAGAVWGGQPGPLPGAAGRCGSGQCRPEQPCAVLWFGWLCMAWLTEVPRAACMAALLPRA